MNVNKEDNLLNERIVYESVMVWAGVTFKSAKTSTIYILLLHIFTKESSKLTNI